MSKEMNSHFYNHHRSYQMKKHLMSIMYLAILSIIFFAFAQFNIYAKQGSKLDPKYKNFQRISEKLNLNDEQISNIKPILVEHQKQIREIRAKYSKDGNFDRLGFWNEIDQMHNELDKKLEKYLTKEQMEELHKMRVENRQNFGSKGQKRKKGKW